jgi:dihydrofolate reductase
MTRVVADITMSLDGYVTGPDAGPQAGLGRGGEPLHAWVFSGDEVDADILREGAERAGAVVMGRNLFDVVDGPDGWNDDMGFGAGHAARPRFFVVTHEPPASVRLGLDITFVTDGVEAAVTRAREAAGDRDVVVMGGGDVVGQTIDQGLADEIVLHVSPIVLGGGTPLFARTGRRELAQRSVRVSPHATHITYVPAEAG